jgi:hypothetical protein
MTVDRLSVRDLGRVAAAVGARVGLPVPERASILALRLKPGRDLTVCFGARGAARPNRPLFALRVGADRMDGPWLRFCRRQVEAARVDSPAPGIAVAPELGLCLHAFPHDPGLPRLAACFEARPGGAVATSLESAARALLGTDAWTLREATVEPLRYKVASRCVLLYRARASDGGPVELVGKLYAQPDRALGLQRALAELHRRLGRCAPIPRPLGADARLGLAWNEAIARTRRSAGPISEENVAWAGAALARLHAAGVVPGLGVWSGGDEAQALLGRATRLAHWQPGLAAAVGRSAERLARRLEAARPPETVVCHGAYKISQLILGPERSAIVDFDGVCLADPALDLGCFLAYLRPAGWWRRPSQRSWFVAAAAGFSHAYRGAALSAGRDPAEVEGAFERARLFEAARLFKIATRPINRLNSPRPVELAQLCREIEGCLEEPALRQ